MKRIMVFWLVLLFPVFVLAQEYEATDINLKVNINDGYMVLTRDNLENNSNLERLDMTEDNMKNIMKKNNIYFDIVKDDMSYEIIIVVPQTTLTFNSLTEANDQTIDSIKNELVKGTGAETSYIYKGQYNYIVVDYYDNNMDYNVINYYTVVNKRGYNIQLQKKEKITEEDKNELKEIVDVINFKIVEENQEKKDVSDKKDSFDYKIIIYGVFIGALAGLITYFIGINIIKRKSSR